MSLSLWLRRALLSSVTCGALIAATIPGCIKKNPSAIVIQINSELTWPANIQGSSTSTADLQEIVIYVSRNGNEFNPVSVSTTLPLPATLTLWNDPKFDVPNSEQAKVTVVATGKRNDKTFTISQDAWFGFPDQETKVVDFMISAGCADVGQNDVCEDLSTKQTCSSGGCQPVVKDLDGLDNYPRPEITDSDQHCFDQTKNGCFQNAVAILPPLDGVRKHAPCSFPLRSSYGIGIVPLVSPTLSTGELNPGINPGLNVAITWKTTGQRYLVLDRDNKAPTSSDGAPRFGWRLGLSGDSKTNLAILLDSEVCDQFQVNGLALVLSNKKASDAGFCSSKTPEVAFCQNTSTDKTKDPLVDPSLTTLDKPPTDCSSKSTDPLCQAL